MSDASSRIMDLFMRVPPVRHTELIHYLQEKYGLKITNFVHDEFVLKQPPEMSEEQLVILETEVHVLFG